MYVYTYARLSTDRQSEASIVDQQRRCHEYASDRNWPISADFVDEGISGAALGNRPELAKALAALEPNDVLLVADLTRLSRSQELAPLLERLRFRGARVIGVLDGFDSASPQARMQAGLSGLMSDEFRASIRARTHSALEMRAKLNQPTGGRAYGYSSSGEIIETEAAVVREIFARAAAGGHEGHCHRPERTRHPLTRCILEAQASANRWLLDGCCASPDSAQRALYRATGVEPLGVCQEPRQR